MQKRTAGILMPISSLPSPYGIGTLGKESYDFVDFLKKSGMKIWQILPLLPTNYGDSPYQSCAGNALNYYFIDFSKLIEEGLLTRQEVQAVAWTIDPHRVSYGTLFDQKARVLKKAFARFDQTNEEFVAFLKEGEYRDFAIFMTLKEQNGHRPWTSWGDMAKYDEVLVEEFASKNDESIRFWQFTQFIFLKQWRTLRAYANENGISIMGDMPLYLAYDSVEVWKYGNTLFRMDEDRKPEAVAGCPPDIFSADGQLWGNPTYDWVKMKKEGYTWWKDRIRYAFRFFDILRIDHFRGFDRYYAIPYGRPDARIGEWVDGPKSELFKDFKDANIVAEDLGILDEGVYKMMDEVGYPGMRVLAFAFDGSPDNSHKPCNFGENVVAYSGTHDNMPLVGMFGEHTKREKEVFVADLKAECKRMGIRGRFNSDTAICHTVIKVLFHSRANTAIVPFFDLLALGEEGRVNHPSTVSPLNWSYRFIKEDFNAKVVRGLQKLVKNTNR